MRTLKTLTLLTSMTFLWGCSRDVPSTANEVPSERNDSPAIAPGDTPFTEEEAPHFDPKLTLAWPGVPQESRRRIDAGTADETTIYSGFYTQTGPVTAFSASVYEFAEEHMRASDPLEMLAGHGTSDSDEELSRKKIEHGRQKHPGFDVTAKSGDSFIRRRVTVLVGRRIYTVEVLSTKERLAAEDVGKFFESFAVNE